MKIFHHNDDDGYCSASIVGHYLIKVYDMPSQDDFFVYSYGKKIEFPEVRKGEEVYIVDLSLDNNIMELIRHCVDNEAKVIHIDHHESTIKFIDKMGPGSKAYLDKIIHFYETGVSASLMTYAYSCFNEDERNNPEDVIFYDANNSRDLFVGDKGYPYSIPLAVRYINDYDIWKFALKETEAFHEGFYSCKWKTNPIDAHWKKLFQTENAFVPPIIDEGYGILKYNETRYELIRKHAFVVDTKYGQCICLNTDAGTSKVFGDLLDQYDFGCMFYYTGTEWKYELRSAERDGVTNVADIAMSFGGGGHAHAAGFKADILIDSISNAMNKQM